MKLHFIAIETKLRLNNFLNHTVSGRVGIFNTVVSTSAQFFPITLTVVELCDRSGSTGETSFGREGLCPG